MKTTKLNLVAAFVIGAVLLSGCSKPTEQEKPQYDATPPAASAPATPAPAANSIAYYAQNLDEAKKTWQECRAKRLSDLTDAEKEQCANAQSAWEMQPYKAGAKR